MDWDDTENMDNEMAHFSDVYVVAVDEEAFPKFWEVLI